TAPKTQYTGCSVHENNNGQAAFENPMYDTNAKSVEGKAVRFDPNLNTVCTMLVCCAFNQVDCFSCDLPAVSPLPRTDSRLAQKLGSLNVGFLALMLLVSVCVSYTHTGIAILRIRSAEGRPKTFSTRSAHLTAILFAYRPVIIIYLQRKPNPLLGAVVQILSSIVSPMLNSLIYSLSNKEVKRSLRRVFQSVMLAVQK
ncbi:hypothetical protein STEG23_025555, partial [Scotinomys teguina]